VITVALFELTGDGSRENFGWYDFTDTPSAGQTVEISYQSNLTGIYKVVDVVHVPVRSDSEQSNIFAPVVQILLSFVSLRERASMLEESKKIEMSTEAKARGIGFTMKNS
jgi:hypothetical protein